MRQMMTVLQRAIPDAGVWWPAETKFEILVGAVLVQNTTWTNTETALANLRTLNLLTPETLAAADSAVVQDAIAYHVRRVVRSLRVQGLMASN